VTKPKPLEWFDAVDYGPDIDGRLPACYRCCDLLTTTGFAEAVASVAIESGGTAADLARRTVEAYHQRQHPAAEWGLG
jgi:hypothetical protein